MKRLLAAFLLICCPALPVPSHAQAQGSDANYETYSPRARQITFQGTRYRLSYVNVTAASTVNEYLSGSDTLAEWNTLIAARHFKNARKIGDVFPQYLRMLRPNLVEEPQTYAKTAGDDRDILLIALLKEPNNAYYEYDLIRFVETADGVMSYQFAKRLPYAETPDVTEIRRMGNQWISELGRFQYPAYTR
ncbi:MAG: hypothetical protein LBL59_05365 [Xanthomonadaceae bacterium]|jgi:hypothetical protein|nr:hypothetical protein [Xanthomonadaceae bacterium]